MTTVLFQRISVPLHRFILLPLLITYVMNVSYTENYIIRPAKTQVSFAIERFKSLPQPVVFIMSKVSCNIILT